MYRVCVLQGQSTPHISRHRGFLVTQGGTLLATVTGGSATHAPSTPHMATEIRLEIRQHFTYYPANATPTLPPISTFVLDSHRGPSSQPATAPYGWDNINSGIEYDLSANGPHHRSVSFSIERFDLHRFDPQKSASVGVHLLPRLPKLTPIEPRVVL